MPFEGPDAVKRAVLAGPGISSVSRLTVRDELASGKLVDLRVASPLFRRQFCVIDHPQKHHGHDVEDWLILGVMMSATREIGHPDVSLRSSMVKNNCPAPAAKSLRMDTREGLVNRTSSPGRPPAAGSAQKEARPSTSYVSRSVVG